MKCKNVVAVAIVAAVLLTCFVWTAFGAEPTKEQLQAQRVYLSGQYQTWNDVSTSAAKNKEAIAVQINTVDQQIAAMDKTVKEKAPADAKAKKGEK
jgi:hypothetical protein